MYCKFPYFEGRPHIPIALENSGKRIRFLPLLDSGADFSIFYKSDALRLGLNWSEGRKVHLSNADGSGFLAYEFKLIIDIEGQKLPVKLCFIDCNESPMPLLGRSNIFDQFKILINERENLIEFQSH